MCFLKRLLKQLKGRIYLIVDGYPVHRSGEVRRFVEQNQVRLRLIRIRGYCSELNSAELLNQDATTNDFGKSRPTTAVSSWAACDGTSTGARNNPRSSETSFKKNASVMPLNKVRTDLWSVQ